MFAEVLDKALVGNILNGEFTPIKYNVKGFDDKYLKIVCESMSGSSEEESNKNYSKIVENISKKGCKLHRFAPC
jgi:hypothetical protein